MPQLTIDRAKCIRCNYCVVDCPMGIVKLDDHQIAECVEENAEICIYCGHCVTVCPTQAIELNEYQDEAKLQAIKDYGIIPFSLKPEDCSKSERGNYPSTAQMQSLIKSRRMTRSYKDKLVDRDILKDIFQTLKYAPSGHNTRGFQVLVVEGREKLDRLTDLTCECFKTILAGGSLSSFDQIVFQRIIEAWEQERIDRVFRTAQEIVVVHCPSSIVPAGPAIISLLTYFEMLANVMGLGTVWAGYFMVAAAGYEPIKEYLKISKDNTIHGSMMFGYPAVNYDLIPQRPEINLSWN